MKFDPAAETRTASLRATHLARKKRIGAAAIDLVGRGACESEVNYQGTAT
jgi:hypothetical protein